MKARGVFGSIRATGVFGKIAVGFIWKGEQVLRSWVKPTFPATPLQVAQNAHMLNAIAEWHASLFTDDDGRAWRLLAGIQKTAQTGPNQMTRKYIAVARAAGTWRRFRDIGSSAQAGFDRQLHANAIADYGAGRVRFGTNIRFMTNDVAAVWQPATNYFYYNIPPGTFTSGDRVYFQFYNGADYPTSDGITGIFYYDQP